MGNDVSEEVNDTTIGPFSFRVFVDCGFTSKYTEMAEHPKGRRSSVAVDGGVRKRLKVEHWGAKERVASQPTLMLGNTAGGVLESIQNCKEEKDEGEELNSFVTSSGRRLRARK